MDCNSIVPVLAQDECNGCFQKPRCIILEEDIPYLTLRRGETFQDFINQVVIKLQEQDDRLTLLENS